MSFMFKPFPYHDPAPINRPQISSSSLDAIVSGTKNVCDFIIHLAQQSLENNDRPFIIGMDGFIGAQWLESIQPITHNLRELHIQVEAFNTNQLFHDADEIDLMLAEYLPLDQDKDPVLLYGKIFHGTYEDFFDAEKLARLEKKLEFESLSKEKKVILVFGNGAAIQRLRCFYDIVFYYDLTPLEMTLRINRGEVVNLGRSEGYEFRRFYYVDFEVAYKLRDELLLDDVSYYVDNNDITNPKLLPKVVFDEVMAALSKYPFRCKPIYLEGVWGGFFFKHLRNLPKEMKNCAWIFDLIPNEVSLLVEAGNLLLEFPFLTFVRKEGLALMGQDCVDRFKGIFPVRLNYDDTYHSNGNMSIQVHPTYDYAISTFGEQFQQDEAYYVVVTGHEAKTYMGFKEDADVDQFFDEVKKSERTKEAVDHDKFVNSVPSKPGMQFLIPSGTIHASGRNQVVLENGSCTMGSMTFKLYDYVRKDINGNLRPIHTFHGRNVIQKYRRTSWVEENIVPSPRLVEQGDSWTEYIVGEYDEIFFSLRRLEFEKICMQQTNGQFHVLTLVDGEQVLVQSLDHPERSYTQNFLDVVVVPAAIDRYVIKNLGTQPIRMHKVMLK